MGLTLTSFLRRLGQIATTKLRNLIRKIMLIRTFKRMGRKIRNNCSNNKRKKGRNIVMIKN
jgi:hypothetical protein